MWYIGIIERNGRRLFVISPAYGKFMASDHAKDAYLFTSEASAREATKPFANAAGDVVLIGRTYFTGDRLAGVIDANGKYVPH